MEARCARAGTRRDEGALVSLLRRILDEADGADLPPAFLQFPNFGAEIIAVRRELSLPPSRIYVNAAASASRPTSSTAGTSIASQRRTSAQANNYPGSVGRTSTTTSARPPPTAPASQRAATARRAPVVRQPGTDGAATPPPAYERTDPNPDADMIRAIMESLQVSNQAPAPASDDEQAPSSSAAAARYQPPPLSTLPADRPPSPPASPVPTSQVSAEDPVRLLTGYETVVLVDDSSSMTHSNRWSSTQHLLGALVDLASRVGASTEVRFLNSNVKGSSLDGRSAVLELFQERGSPGGVTALGGKVEEVLLDYLGKLDQEREVLAALESSEEVERIKPLNLIVLTDGCVLPSASLLPLKSKRGLMGFPFPSPRNFIKLTRHRPQHNPFLPPSAPSDDPESVIVAAARRLDRGHWPLSQLGVFFCQVGDDGEAREALQELDDNLQTTYDIRVRPTAVAPRRVKNVERGLTSFSSVGHGGHDRLLSARERTIVRSGRQAPAQGVARRMEQTGRSKRMIGHS